MKNSKCVDTIAIDDEKQLSLFEERELKDSTDNKKLVTQALETMSLDCGDTFRIHCDLVGCALFPYCTQRIVNKKMIREYCFQCMNRNAHEIRLCLSMNCPFYDFRMGSNAKLP